MKPYHSRGYSLNHCSLYLTLTFLTISTAKGGQGDCLWHSAKLIHRRINEGGNNDIEYCVHYEGFNRR